LKGRKQQGESSKNLQRLCQAVLQAYSPVFQDVEIEALFYPYIGLTHTIRRCKNGWRIRISDHCRNAPQPVIEAIVAILVCKLLRRSPRRGVLETYAAYRRQPSVADAVRARRLLKGRKIINRSEGKYHSLQEIHREINARYFNHQVDIRAIGWGKRVGRSRLGHYDSVHHTITLSPMLDSPHVPKYVASYIVYHELLHAVFEDASSSGRQRHHSAAFRRAERAYPDYAEARKFLREFCRKRPGNMI